MKEIFMEDGTIDVVTDYYEVITLVESLKDLKDLKVKNMLIEALARELEIMKLKKELEIKDLEVNANRKSMKNVK